VSVAEEATEETEQREPHPPRRVVLLSEGTGLAGLLKHLLGPSGQVDRFASLLEAVEQGALEDADTLVVDLPSEGLGRVLADLRHHYQGALIVVSNRGQQGGGVFHPAWTLLTRPFSVHTLGVALRLPGYDRGEEPRPTGGSSPPGPAGQRIRPTSATDVETDDRRPPFWARLGTSRASHGGFGQQMLRPLAALARGWQTRRPVRVAGFSVLALVAFSIAFALAAQGRCGLGCDALGTGFSTAPTIPTIDSSKSSAPPTKGPKRAAAATTTTSTAGEAGSPGAGAFRGISGARLSGTATGRRATATTTAAATTRETSSSSPTTKPPTTPTTTPTTVPPTTGTAQPTTTATTPPAGS